MQSIQQEQVGVKRRTYDASRRRARAARSRDRILEVARRRFLNLGYAGTTTADIAAEAGVSVDAVYKTFGSKPRLVKAVFDAAVAGDEPIEAAQRAIAVSRQEADPRARLRAFGAFVTEITPRAAPVMLLVRAAADSDAELGAIWTEMNSERLESMTRHAQRLSDDGHLRNGVSVEEACDVLWALCSPELYDLLARRRGWSAQRLGAWIGESYIAALLPPR